MSWLSATLPRRNRRQLPHHTEALRVQETHARDVCEGEGKGGEGGRGRVLRVEGGGERGGEVGEAERRRTTTMPRKRRGERLKGGGGEEAR
eukprot:3887852-Rhodomonas_salina.1